MKATFFHTILTIFLLKWTTITSQPQTGKSIQMNSSMHLTVEIESPLDWIRLPCNVSGGSSYQWKRYFSTLPLNGFKGKDNSLILDSLSYKDSGLYGCTTCNNTGCSRFNVTLEVLHKISEESMVNKAVVVDGEVKFDCDLNVEPNFSYRAEFYKFPILDKHDLKSLQNLTMLNTNDTKSLIIENVRFEDSGWYSCVINHVEFLNFGNSDEPYKINNYLSFKKAYLKVLESYPTEEEFDKNQQHSITILTIVGIASICFILLIISAAFTYRLIKQKNKYYQRWIKSVTVTKALQNIDSKILEMPTISIEKKQLISKMKDSFELAPVLEYEFPIDWDWEFPREKLSLGKKLGEGAFGRVFMAVAEGLLQEGVTSSVAVKMLKDECLENEVLDLVCELEIMKMVGKHPNVVNLLGSCAQDGPLYVIMEFAAHGNLKDFLRGHTLRTENNVHEAKTLTQNQLIKFGLQISVGMQYISSMKLIHRDLAARNILVSEGLVMKITDFGLARDVHSQDYYRKTTSGKLPIRWMAPESLEERFFDAKTDVWSFGVLLWEIMSFGRSPYKPSISWEHLLESLKRGDRLEKPADCPEGMYEIMTECWQMDAQNRPTFEQIMVSLERILGEESSESLDFVI